MVSIVSVSCFTPGLRNADGVRFEKGEQVTYRLRSGQLVQFTVDSELMTSPGAPGDGTGYEGTFSDDGKRGFAARTSIIDWPGKVPAGCT